VEGGFVEPSFKLGHRLREAGLRDGDLDGAPEREVEIAIVGGGPAGLSAAWRLARRGLHDFLLLELEAEAGGTSRAGQSPAGRYPWGAHYITAPGPDHPELMSLLGEMNALESNAADATGGFARGREELLVREPAERLFYKGFWYPGLYPSVAASPGDRAELARFEAEVHRLASLRDSRGRRAFTIPIARCSNDAEFTALDRISAADWLTEKGYRSPALHWLLDYACRDDYGLTLSDTSAWALLFYHAARLDPGAQAEAEVLTWPAGNGALVEHLAAAAGDRRLNQKLVVTVDERGPRVRIAALDTQSGKLEVIACKHAIVATPHFVTTRIVRGLGDSGDGAVGGFEYGPWLVANLHLRGPLSSRGAAPCWDNVLYDSPSVGYVNATHQRGRERGPQILTYYLPMTDSDPAAARARLLEPDWGAFRDAVVADLARAHGDLAERLERLDVCRWGHGMIQPRLGHLFSEARREARKPLGRVHFAHSDLSGIALFEEAFHHGRRAADAVLEARARELGA